MRRLERELPAEARAPVGTSGRTEERVAALASELGDAPDWPELVALRELPRRRLHPLRVYLEERGITLRDAAERYLRCSPRVLESVVTKWHRPRNAVAWARMLRVPVDDLFPLSPEGGLVDKRALAEELHTTCAAIDQLDREGQPHIPGSRGSGKRYDLEQVRAWHEARNLARRGR